MPAGGTAPRGPRGPGPRRTAPCDRAARPACAACRAWPGQAACRAGPTRAAWTSSGSSFPASPPARRCSPAPRPSPCVPPPAPAAAPRRARRARRMWAASRSCYSDPIAVDVKEQGRERLHLGNRSLTVTDEIGCALALYRPPRSNSARAIASMSVRTARSPRMVSCGGSAGIRPPGVG